MKKRILYHLQFLFFVHLSGLLFFMVFRIFLLISEFSQLNGIPDKYTLLFKALIMGLRFDNVISCYIISIPLVVLTLTTTLKFDNKLVNKSTNVYLSVLYILSFFICAADIPYFEQFFKHINSSIFNWAANFDFVFKMVIQDKKYLMYFLLFLIIAFIFVVLILKISKKYNRGMEINTFGLSTKYYMPVNFLIYLFFIGLCILGIRGRIEKKSPILVGTAFFSNYAFPNQLGLNPVFTLIRDVLDSMDKENKTFQLMNNATAIKNVEQYLGIIDTAGLYSPVTRIITSNSTPLRTNVVLVVMEGMSASYMQEFGQKRRLTPFLDSLSNQSLFFKNIYSSGIHTMNGLYATLYGYPSLLMQHPLRKVDIGYYNGFAGVLADKGYQTLYFTNHDDQFDNVAGFLLTNGYQRIVSQKNYPGNKVLSTLGVADDYMFEFSIPILNKLSKNGSPFFVTLSTSSNHGPYIVPEYFKSQFQSDRDKALEYSDWALKKFLNLCSIQNWYDNTIFIFVADHGAIVGEDQYDMPLSYNHCPLIIYNRNLFKPQRLEQMGGQIDVFPTIMGILQESYTNTTLGIDLFREKRPYIYFSDDDKIGCTDQNYLYIYHTDGREALYNMNLPGKKNCIGQFSDISSRMKNYAFSMLQTTQWLILNHKTGIKNKK